LVAVLGIMRDVDSDSLITIPLAEDELELLRTGLSPDPPMILAVARVGT